MSLSAKIALGLAGGVVTGLFLGERAAFLEWPAKAFVQLLQVTVMPYLVTSLISGIASGSSGQARRLFTRAGVIVLVLWALSLALVFVVPLALPPSMGGAFYSTATVSSQERIDWIDLYIPSNPFRSLSNNLVPAVVVFSALLGIALIGLRDKDRVLGPLRLIGDTLGRAGSMLVALTPIGIFAIAGHAAGTLRLEEFERLQAYLLVSIGLHGLFTLWILPGLTSALTGIPYRRIVTLIWDPLITAFATANLFIVLPLIQERSKQLLAEQHLGDRGFGRSRRRAGADLFRISERRQAPEHLVHPICRLVHWRSPGRQPVPVACDGRHPEQFRQPQRGDPVPAGPGETSRRSVQPLRDFERGHGPIRQRRGRDVHLRLCRARRVPDDGSQEHRQETSPHVRLGDRGLRRRVVVRQPAAARRRDDRAGTDRDDVRPSASVRRVGQVGHAGNRRRGQRDRIPCAAARAVDLTTS